MGSARAKKAAETNAARKFLKNLFCLGKALPRQKNKSPLARRIFVQNKQLSRIEVW
jgi:hypothetical protein